jgi:hypothetical protein
MERLDTEPLLTVAVAVAVVLRVAVVLNWNTVLLTICLMVADLGTPTPDTTISLANIEVEGTSMTSLPRVSFAPRMLLKGAPSLLQPSSANSPTEVRDSGSSIRRMAEQFLKLLLGSLVRVVQRDRSISVSEAHPENDSTPREERDCGSSATLRDVQSLKAASLIAVKLAVSRRLISSRRLHPANARVDMVVTPDGSFTDERLEQFSKQETGMRASWLWERSTVVKEEQSANAENPKVLRVWGVASVGGSMEHPEKAASPMDLIAVLLRSRVARELQPKSADDPIDSIPAGLTNRREVREEHPMRLFTASSVESAVRLTEVSWDRSIPWGIP